MNNFRSHLRALSRAIRVLDLKKTYKKEINYPQGGNDDKIYGQKQEDPLIKQHPRNMTLDQEHQRNMDLRQQI